METTTLILPSSTSRKTSGGKYQVDPPAIVYLTKTFLRNLGIIIAFPIGFCATHILATEYITEKKSKGQVLLFPRGAVAAKLLAKKATDIESPSGKPVLSLMNDSKTVQPVIISDQAAILHWEDVCYDIKIKGEPRRILDHVDGWVKPGTLTALMVTTTPWLFV